jgi:fibronectin type 3 domain-containing protein
MKLFSLLVLLILSYDNAVAQVRHEIRAIAKAYQDSIVIRWAPATPLTWQALNRVGYRIERYTVLRNSVVLVDKPLIMLEQNFKPAPKEAWIPLIEVNDLVAISAQAIFGEDFKLNSNSSSILDVVNNVTELESRHSFCLYASDLSPVAAALSGLRLVDKNIKANEGYLYKIYPAVPQEYSIEEGFVYVDAGRVLNVSKPMNPLVDFGDRIATISWDCTNLASFYSGYFIEKSLDGKTYNRINKIPITPVTTKDDGGSLYILKNDSLASNDQEVYYRIYGITPFGDIGPRSEASFGKGLAKITAKAYLTKYEVDKEHVRLFWDFPKNNEEDIKTFDIERSKNGTDFLPIQKSSFGQAIRSGVDESPATTNYYRVVSNYKSGVKSYSFPLLVQLYDSIAPATPSLLQSSCNSSGVVTLSWAANQEIDLLGYHVYRSNFEKSEFSRITREPIEASLYFDTLDGQSLQKKVYYRITSIDKRFNSSLQTHATAVKLPDRNPPVAPVIHKASAKSDSVFLEFGPSSSVDVAKYELVKENAKLEKVKIFTYLKGEKLEYKDKLGVGENYRFAICAADSAGNRSNFVYSQIFRTVGEPQIPEGFMARANRESKSIVLTWKFSGPNASKFIVYRSEIGQPLALYKSIVSTSQEFSDDNIKPSSAYTYAIKVVLKNGLESKLSELITIEY